MVELFPDFYACPVGFGYNLIRHRGQWLLFNDEDMRLEIEKRAAW